MHIYNRMLAHAGLLRSPPGEESGAGGGAGDEGGGGDDGGDDDSFTLDDLKNEDGEGPGDELAELLKGFGGTAEDEDDGDDDTGEDESYTDVDPEQVKALSTRLNTAISNMTVPDNLIPDDFDPNDKEQMRDLLNKAMRTTLTNSLGVVFQPMQLAIAQMIKGTKSEIARKINQTTRTTNDNAVIYAEVPEFKDPRFKKMLEPMNAAMIESGKKPKERAQLLRKMLNQMGVKKSASPRHASGDPTPKAKSGTAALDELFGKMPKF